MRNKLWLRTWRLGEWLNAPVSPLFETFMLPILVEARERGGSGRLGVRLPRTWSLRRPAYAVIDGYYYSRAEPDPWTVALLPIRFVSSELAGGWIGEWERRALPEYVARLDRYRAIALSSAADGALLRLCDDLAGDVGDVWYAVCLASGGVIPMRTLLRNLCGRLLKSLPGGDETVLLSGVRTPVVEEQESLARLGVCIAESPSVAAWLENHPVDELATVATDDPELASFRDRLREHLARYGHQISTLDLAVPCLAEEPARVSVALRCYLEPDAVRPWESRARLERAREDAVARVRASLPRLRRLLFDRILQRVHAYVVARDTALFHLQMGWPLLRVAFLELGRRLAERKVVSIPNDVFFLTHGELRGIVAGDTVASTNATLAARRDAWNERHACLPPAAIPSAGHPAWARAMRWPINLRTLIHDGADARVIVGTPASPGRVRARACVLGFPSEFTRLQRGDVLVAVSTTPDWTPLFARAGAVVTDVGAVSSHCSVVAREYGIPAVVGTQSATRRIANGQVITVDGGRGRVHLE